MPGFLDNITGGQLGGAAGALGGAASMLSPLGWAGMGVSAIGSIGKLLTGLKQNKLANQINPIWSQYTGSNAVNQSLGAVQNAYQGRMPGAAAASDRILQSQANVLANASRGATDASQLLSVGAGTEGAADEAGIDLAGKEGQYKTGLLSNLQSAYDAKTEDDRKIYESKLLKYQMDSQAKADLRKAGMGNIAGAGSDIGGMFLQGERLKQLNNPASRNNTFG
jgi:hypothetical protein